MSKKFSRPVNYKNWTREQTQTRVNVVQEEIVAFSRDISLINSIINTLKHRKEEIALKISNKDKYLNQLIAQLEEHEKNS